MKPTLAVLAPGAMGAALAARLVAGGADVVTVLDGRSAHTIERARVAGMRDVPLARIPDADVVLSVVPPSQVLPLAQRLAPALAAAAHKPVFVDCNAVNPQTVMRLQSVIEPTGATFVDGSLIGMPPREGYGGPTLFVSGAQASRLAALTPFGLKVHVLDAPVGAASALKMCYGGITKGMIALASAMMLASVRHGVDRALLEEMGRSQAALLTGFSKSVPDMFGKAARWVPEMQEIAAMIGTEHPEGRMFETIAHFYERLAQDQAADGREIQMLAGFFRPS
jgi:3-hydroxyisobutyrate dehydrogenase-like beta-hydroxyacid dehydrogenase